MLDATKRGLPALAGVDPILLRDLGQEYIGARRGVHRAGAYVRDTMHEMGYVPNKRRHCPDHSFARSGLTYRPR